MLNIKSVVDGGFIKYEEIKEVSQNFHKTIGIVMNGHLMDVPIIEKVFDKQPLIGVRKRFDINGEMFSLVLYAKNDKGKENVKRLANMDVGGLTEFKMLTDMKIVIESTNISIQTLLEANAVLSNDIYFAANEENVDELKDIEGIKLVDFREIGYFKYPQYYKMYDLMLRGSQGEGISEYVFSNTPLDIKDYSYEIKKLNISWQTVKTDVVHLPFWKSLSEYQPSKAFFDLIGNEIISKMTNAEMKAAACLFDKAIVKTIEQYTAENEQVFRIIVNQLKLVFEKKYTLYFLVVEKIFSIGHDNGIKFGSGRGSVCGFLLAKVLGFVDVDALEFDLLEERFISKYRMDKVDIDIDVSQRDRDKLIKLIEAEFGHDCVAYVMTKNRLGFRNAKKEYLKHVTINPKRLRELEALEPENFETLNKFLEKPEAKQLYDKSKDMRDLLEVCYYTQDAVKSFSKHAAAIIISDVPIIDLVPVYKSENGILVTQFTNDEKALENAGLIKIDLLGLANIDRVSDARALITSRYSNNPDVLKKLEVDYNDEKTLDLYAEGKTIGVFQMESWAARKYAVEMAISSFKDVVALNAMNRPGPMDFIPKYAEIKKDPSKRIRLEGMEIVDAITDRTHGIIVYQEQINKIAIQFAGYSPAEAEMFRQAVSKKDEEAITSERIRFIQKAVAMGRKQENAELVYTHILKFARFGFNEGHSVGYGKMSFENAYLKANFPLEYMTAILNLSIGDKEKVKLYIDDAIEMGINILGLDINKSQNQFVIEGDAIRAPFQLIPGIGNSFANDFAEVRENYQFADFTAFRNFLSATDMKFAKLEDFIKVGGFDSVMGKDSRWDLLGEIHAKRAATKPTMIEEFQTEMEIMGLALSEKVVDYYKVNRMAKSNKNYMFGTITKIVEEPDTNGNLMGKIEFTKFDGYMKKLVVFYRDWTKMKELLQEGNVYLMKVEKNVLKEAHSV